MSQFNTTPALPNLDPDIEAPLRAARTDSLVTKNRAKAPPGVEELRDKPRLSIGELNQLDLDELRERYFADDRDVRPPIVKALDIVDLPRNTIANIAFGKPTASGMAGTVAGTALGGAGIGAILGGPPGALAGAGIGAAIGVGAQAVAGVGRLLSPSSVKDDIADDARKGAFGQPSISVSDALRNMGVRNRVALAVGGFVGDVAIDPLTYIGPAGWGASAGRTAISGSGRKVLDRAIKTAGVGGIESVSDPVAKRLLLAAGYQPGQKVDDLSKAIWGDISKSKVERVFRPLGAERTSEGGIFSKYADKARHTGNVAEHEAIDAVREFNQVYGRGRAGYNLRLGKAATDGAGSEVLHVPFGGKFFPEMTVQVPAFTRDANRAVRQYQVAKSKGIAAGLSSPEAVQAFGELNSLTESARSIHAEVAAEQKRVSDRLDELAAAIEDGDPAAQTEAANLRMEMGELLRSRMEQIRGNADAGIEGLGPAARRMIKNNPVFTFKGERANVDEILRLGELRTELEAHARMLDAQANRWQNAVEARSAGRAEITKKVTARAESFNRLREMQETSRTPAGLGAYLDDDGAGNLILNADADVQSQVFEQIRPTLDEIDELEGVVESANRDGLGLSRDGLEGGAQPLFVDAEALPDPRVAEVQAASSRLEELRAQLWAQTEPLRREKGLPPIAMREPLNPGLQPTKLPKIKPPKEPKPASKAGMIAAARAKYPEALAKNLPPGKKRMVEMPSEDARVMFLAEQSGDDHGRLMAHLIRMDKEGVLAEWQTGGVLSVKAGSLNVGDTFKIDGATARVVDDADGITLEITFKEGNDIPMGDGEVLEAGTRVETFRLAPDDDVPYNADSLVETTPDPAATATDTGLDDPFGPLPPEDVPPAAPPAAAAAPDPNSRTMQTAEEFEAAMGERTKAAMAQSQRDLWDLADSVDVPGLDKIANTPNPAEVLASSLSAEADAVKAMYDSLGGVLDAHRTPEFENLVRVVKMALGTDDDFIAHSTIGSMRSALGGLYNDKSALITSLESMDRSHRKRFGARGGWLARMMAGIKGDLTNDNRLLREQIATTWAKRIDEAAAKAGVPLEMQDDVRRMATIYAQEAAARTAGVPSPVAMKVADEAGNLVDSGELIALREVMDRLQQAGVKRSTLVAEMRVIGDETAELIKSSGDEAVRDGLLEMLLPGYFPHVTGVEARESLAAKKLLPNFQSGGMSAAYSGAKKGGAGGEQFQKATTTDIYVFEDPRNPGKYLQFMEMDRWAAGMSDEAIQALRSADPALADRAERMRTLVEMYERLPDPPPPQRLGTFTANKLQREGKFGALSIGDAPFFEESLPHILATRLGSQSRAVAREQLADLAASNALRFDAAEALKLTRANNGPVPLPNGMTLEQAKNGGLLVRARGRVWRQLSPQMAGLKDNPVLAAIDKGTWNFLLPEELADAIEDTARVWEPEQASEMLDAVERATSMMRQVTLLHPSWTISNIVGNITNAAAAGVPVKKMLSYLPAVLKVRMARNAGGDALDRMSITAAGQTMTGADANKMFTEYDLFGDHIPGMVMAEASRRGFNQVPSAIRERGLKAQYEFHLAKLRKSQGLAEKGLRAMGGGADIGYDRLNRWVFGPWVRANSVIEDAFRGAAMLAVLDDGADVLSAQDKVRRGLFSYHDLTRFEEKWMRNIFPFYTWMRNNMAFQLHTLLTRPSYIAAVPRTRDAIEELLAGEAQVPMEARPTWMQSALAMQLGSDPDRRFALVLGNTIPQAEAYQAIQGITGADGAADVAKYFLGNVSNLITAAPQLATRTQFFSGRQIGVGNNGGDVSAGQFALDMVRPVAEYGPTGKVWKAAGRSATEGLGRAVLGGRIQAFDEDRIRSTRSAEFRQEVETFRRGIRKAERDGKSSVEQRAGLMRTYAAMVKAGYGEDVPRYAQRQLEEIGAANVQ